MPRKLNNDSLISAENVSGGFQTKDGASTAVVDVSIELKAGRILAVVGPNGCGKTTLLRLLAGLLEPVKGKIKMHDRKERAAMVFQQVSQNLIPWLTVGKNITVPGQLRGKDKYELRKASQSALNELGISYLIHKYPNQLSGGQQQLCVLARWFALKPSILLFDEGWSMLDLVQRAKARSILASMANQGTSLVIVSHDLGELSRCAHDVMILSDKPGRVRRQLTLDDLAPNERLELLWNETHLALGTPPTALSS